MTVNRSHSSSASRRYTLAAAPLVIGAAALYNWVIWPHVGYLHAMQRLEPAMERMAEELDAVTGSLEEKLSTMRSMQVELAKTREGLFTHEESNAFIHEIQGLVAKAGCAMERADFSPGKEAQETEDPNAPAAMETLYADFTIVGQYEQLVALFRMLGERRQKVWVDSCRIDLLDPRDGRLECQLGLTIYIVLQPGEPHP